MLCCAKSILGIALTSSKQESLTIALRSYLRQDEVFLNESKLAENHHTVQIICVRKCHDLTTFTLIAFLCKNV